MTRKRERLVLNGYEVVATKTAELLRESGAVAFRLGYSHPDYPDADPTDPPPGVAVTWWAAATYRRAGRARRRRPLATYEVRHEATPTADHARGIALACTGLLERLGASVTVVDADGREVVGR